LRKKSNEIPTAPELIEALGVKDRLFTLGRRALSKKSFARVIKSGNHLLTQVKDNQPGLRESSSWDRRDASRATARKA